MFIFQSLIFLQKKLNSTIIQLNFHNSQRIHIPSILLLIGAVEIESDNI